MTVAVDWVAVSSIVTAAATLVLAIATFASVRSANRAARAAERSLLAGLRPLLAPSRLDDQPQKVGFADDKWFLVPGGAASRRPRTARSTSRSRAQRRQRDRGPPRVAPLSGTSPG